MKLRLRIVNTERKFEVQVLDGRKIVERLDWYGGHSNRDTSPFEYQGKAYVVFGPYHSFRNDELYHLYEMTGIDKA